MHREAIADIIRTIENFGRELARLSASVSQHDRAQLIAMRRGYAELAHGINDAVEKALAAMPTADSAELQMNFRTKTGNIRKATAEHQARFTAVSVADDPLAYGASVKRVSEMQQDLLLWLKTQLLPLLPR